MKRIVIMGGGTGQASLLRGLKSIDDIHISTIVTVADDGGSTGRLREEFNLPAMGDIRNVMVALAESETLFSQILDYRFSEHVHSSLAGHNIGNIILTALTDTTGNFMDAIVSLSKVMNVKGDIIPSSTDFITLCARMNDGTIVRGESNIPMYQNNIREVYYDVEVKATQQAVDAIRQADVILFGVGSLYTSILPNIIIEDIRQAILDSAAKRVYYCNFMTQPGETDGYTGEDHVEAIESHLKGTIDLVVESTNLDVIPESILQSYRKQGSEPVQFQQANHHYKIMKQSLMNFENEVVRHDHLKVRDGFLDVLEAIDVL